MDLSTLYWILILPNIKGLMGAAFFIGLLAAVLIPLGYGMMSDYGEEATDIKKAVKKTVPFLLIPSVIIGSLTAFIPTEKQMMYLIGGYAATNVENIEKLPKNVVNAANKFLESYTDTEKKDK